jgi:hypothetical protein
VFRGWERSGGKSGPDSFTGASCDRRLVFRRTAEGAARQFRHIFGVVSWREAIVPSASIIADGHFLVVVFLT